MGQRTYVLSKNEYSNILGIFTNIRQVRKFRATLILNETDNIILHEVRLNEPEKGCKNMTKLLEEKDKQEDNELLKLRRENQELKHVLKGNPEVATIKHQIKKDFKQKKRKDSTNVIVSDANVKLAINTFEQENINKIIVKVV